MTDEDSNPTAFDRVGIAVLVMILVALTGLGGFILYGAVYEISDHQTVSGVGDSTHIDDVELADDRFRIYLNESKVRSAIAVEIYGPQTVDRHFWAVPASVIETPPQGESASIGADWPAGTYDVVVLTISDDVESHRTAVTIDNHAFLPYVSFETGASAILIVALVAGLAVGLLLFWGGDDD